MSAEQNKALMRRFYDEVANKGNLDAADELIAFDFVDHEELPGTGPGVERVKQMFTIFRRAFPDLHMDIEDLVAEGDKVVARVTMTGTHNGEFMGVPPTGKKVSINTIDMVRIVEEKVVEHWGVTDTVSMMEQLGAIPTQ